MIPFRPPLDGVAGSPDIVESTTKEERWLNGDRICWGGSPT